MRARLALGALALGALALAGCNQILGNGNFTGPGGSIDAPQGVVDGTPDGPPPDTSMFCQDMSLPPTTITGTVYAPNGTLPLANALVYVPSSTPDAFTPGVHCGCIPATGGAITSAVTDSTGSFTLTDPPTGANVPIVIQLGKWRRQLILPNVPQCNETDLTAAQTRLPKNASEGDMPFIAVSTGAADQLECLLRQVGVDDSEFGTVGGLAHVQMVTDPIGRGISMYSGGPLATQAAMLGSLTSYDHVMFSCPGTPEMPTAAQASSLTTYANEGGQVFLEHFHNTWISASPEWAPVATFAPPNGNINNTNVTIDSTFPKGQLLMMWMQGIGALDAQGAFPEQNARITAQTVDITKAQPWIHLDAATAMGTSGDEVFTFPSSTSCGRVIFSDMHATGAGGTATTFPAECLPMALDPQQDALAFLFFDEATCLQ